MGYIGSIANWIDLKNISTVAIKMSDVNFIMVGPISSTINVSPYLKIPNLHFMGACSYKEVPNYIKKFDVCLVPFKFNILTKMVNPVKIYEYFALGKPVVSIPIPEIKQFKNLLYFYNNAIELENSIRKGLDENNPQKSAARIRIAHQNTWDARSKIISRFILDSFSNAKIDFKNIKK